MPVTDFFSMGVLVQVADAGQQRFRHLVGREDQRGVAGIDRAFRHAVVLGGGRLLYQRDAARAQYRAQSQCTVGAGAGEDDADRLFTLVFCQ